MMNKECQRIDMEEYCRCLKEAKTRDQTRVYHRLCKFFNVSEDYTDTELAKSYRKFMVKYYPDNTDGNIKKLDKVKDFDKKLKQARKYITER